MKCPSCRKPISILEIKPVFQCPHCENKLQITNQTRAILISFGVFVFISILSWATIIYHESPGLSFLFEIVLGGSISIFTYKKVIEYEIFDQSQL